MNEEEANKMPVLVGIGWCFVLLGWLLAGVYATGSEVQRLSMVVPVVFLGSVILLFGQMRVSWTVWTAVTLAIFYFLARARLSEVWDIARYDVILVGVGGMSFFAAAVACRFRAAKLMLVVAALVLLTGNLAVAAIQGFENESFAWLRGPRTDTEGVSGFYYQRNYLAGFLSIALPLFVGIATANPRRWLIIGPFVALGIIACFFSNSRGGFITMVLGCGLTFFILGARNQTQRNGRSWWKTAAIFVALVIGLVGSFFLWQEIVRSRGQDMESNLQSRLSMAGVAFEVWMSHLLFGKGGQAYSYEFPRLVDSSVIGSYFGDAERAHCDFLQILCDYGLVGFLLVVALIGLLLYYARPGQKDIGWMAAVAFSVLIAESLRAGFDFNLRILPNLMLFAMVTGGALSVSGEGGRAIPARMVQAVTLLIAGAAATWWVLPEIRNAPLWIQREKARLEGDESKRWELTESYLERAPEFHRLRGLARVRTSRAIETGEAEDWQAASKFWKGVFQLHHLDGETLANYARSLDELGQFQAARDLHRRAIVAVGNRENKYGVFHGAAMHLAKRALALRGERKAGEALFLFERASEFQEESFKRNFKRKEIGEPTGQWLKTQIDFLKGARIDPVEIDALDLDQVLNEMRAGD